MSTGQEVDKWVPDYSKECEVCGQSPVVQGALEGEIVYRGEMCGVCTWGSAKFLDVEEWN